jgi:hypothetical protein
LLYVLVACQVMAVVGDEGIPAAASGSDATDRPPSEIRRQLLLSLGYEAKHGFVNVVSSVTGKQFSDVLVRCPANSPIRPLHTRPSRAPSLHSTLSTHSRTCALSRISA